MPDLKLLLIRHAESVGNTQKRMEGQSSTPLTERGIQQAQTLAQSLTQPLASAASGSPLIDWPTHLYTSPLQRAEQTAQYLSDALHRLEHPFKTVVDGQLQEIHQGVFQGLTWQEAQVQFPSLCAQLLSSLEWQPVPEAESPSAARARAQSWLQHLLNTHCPGDTIWIVSHAGIMLHLIAEIMGCNRTWETPISHTAAFEFWLSSPHSSPTKLLTKQNIIATDYNLERWILHQFN